MHLFLSIVKRWQRCGHPHSLEAHSHSDFEFNQVYLQYMSKLLVTRTREVSSQSDTHWQSNKCSTDALQIIYGILQR
jgi:hypothetical protein